MRLDLTGDGNFKADHVAQNPPSKDYHLLDGGGIFPNRQEYLDFLKTAMERNTVRKRVPVPHPLPRPSAGISFADINAFQRAACENTFRAISNALCASKSCDVTGIVAIACARHSCFVLNAMVDLFASEQQKNMDFALLKVLQILGIDPEQGIMFMYDIVCQYIIHLQERIGYALPPGLQIDRAIGMFHVHAHKEQCFFRYAPSLIPGAGVTAGEILESLWSGLNGISPSTRTATLAHRSEVLDDHACDSNHKKMVGMTKFLCRQHKNATSNLEEAQQYLAELTNDADDLAIQQWTQEIEDAEQTRLVNAADMDIYGARVGHTQELTDPYSGGADAAPTSATKVWLELALLIEEKQWVIVSHIDECMFKIIPRIDIRQRLRHYGRDPRGDDRQKLDKMRETLAPLLVELNRLQIAAGVYQCEAPQPPSPQPVGPHSAPPGPSHPGAPAPPTPTNQEPMIQEQVDPLAHWDIIVQDVDEPTIIPDPETEKNKKKKGPRTRSQATEEDLVPPEKQPLHIPSNKNVTPRHDDLELTLRKNQARTHLHQLRELIAEKSFQYSDVLQKAPRKGVKTRARGTLKGINTRISLHCQVYSHCRTCLIQLGADELTLQSFRELKKQDIKASTAVLKPNTRGSTALKLSWIWTDTRRHVLPDPDAELPASDAATILECM
jgi:hypothetical protein